MIKKLMKKFKDDEQGLTLVELLAVIVILAIVAAIAFVMIGNVMENAKKDAHIANAQQLVASAKLYHVTEDANENPVTGKTLHEARVIDVLIDPWDKVVYKDPQGTVTVDDEGLYSVELVSNTATNCSIDKTEVELNEEDRDDICD